MNDATESKVSDANSSVRRVTDDDVHVRAGVALRERLRGVLVRFDGDELAHAMTQPLRRGARSGAEFEHVRRRSGARFAR